jgi:serine/threonine-protein kinase PknK
MMNADPYGRQRDPAGTQHAMDATQRAMDATQGDVDATQGDVDATQADVNATQRDMDATQFDLGGRVASAGVGEVHSGGGVIAAQLCGAGFEDAQEIGRGGFGVVYRCRQVGLERVVAVKVLTAEVDDVRARFVREQQAMARLTGHPNIASVLQVGQTASGYLFLVMPFCGRGCLHARIRALGVLPLDEVLHVGVKMAGALESAHRAGILHRDVKPANILITDYGEPALSDFGLARTGDGFKTATGVLVGTLEFTAPELLDAGSPTPASDVYGLGATLFFALTGHAAFERRDGEELVAHFVRIATGPVPDLREQGIPDEVATVVEKAMAREADDRPSALQLGELIQLVQDRYGLAVDEMALQDTEGAGESPRPAQRSANSIAVRGAGRRLPSLPTGLVGRKAELAKLRELLAHSRLVTLTGIGGVGKTTLATYAAGQLAAEFPDGVWFVELANLREGSLLVEVVAAALGVREQSARQLTDVLRSFLGRRKALLVMDNCEQIIDDAAKLVETLLQDCPQVQFIATSREILDVSGEAVLPLAPLACPDSDDDHASLDSLTDYDAVALFVERARAAIPDFTVTARNAAAVARISARLEGLPLAIELAAARLRALSVEQIAEGLSDRYSLLSHGRRHAPTRQQSLSWCIGWSYELCTRAEQELWQQLSVFAGSFDLLAAQHICAEDLRAEECLDVLCTLVDKSILIRTEHDGAVQFRLLDTLREYGRARISDSEYSRLRRHHAHYYQRLLADLSGEWFGPHQIRCIRRARRQMPDIREALQFSLSDSPAAALEMAGDLRQIWVVHGLLSEARRWVELALAATPPEASPQRVRALFAAMQIALFAGDVPAAEARGAEARQLLQTMDDPPACAKFDLADGFIAMQRGDVERGRDCCQSALATTDDPEIENVAMFTMAMLGQLSADLDQSLTWSEKALAHAKSHGTSVERSQALMSVALARWQLGESGRAKELLQQGLQLQLTDDRWADDRWTGAQLLEVLSWVEESSANPRQAAVLMASAAAVSRATGAQLLTFAQVGRFHDECERRIRQQLDATEFEAIWNRGNSLAFDDAVAIALRETD